MTSASRATRHLLSFARALSPSLEILQPIQFQKNEPIGRTTCVHVSYRVRNNPIASKSVEITLGLILCDIPE